MKVEAIMTRSVLFCQAHQPLRQVWENLNERSLRCVPLLDRDIARQECFVRGTSQAHCLRRR